MTMVESVLIAYGAISAFATCAYIVWGWVRARREMVYRERDASVYAPIALR
jgi:hypothetical protein